MAFESDETIFGSVRQSNEQIKYRGVLKVADSGKERVSLELVFVPPLPFSQSVNHPDMILIVNAIFVFQSVRSDFSKTLIRPMSIWS